MEISVGFADKEKEYYEGQGYICDKSVLGRVYYPEKGVVLEGRIAVRYMNYPWISTFEIDGIRAAPADESLLTSQQQRHDPFSGAGAYDCISDSKEAQIMVTGNKEERYE